MRVPVKRLPALVPTILRGKFIQIANDWRLNGWRSVRLALESPPGHLQRHLTPIHTSLNTALERASPALGGKKSAC